MNTLLTTSKPYFLQMKRCIVLLFICISHFSISQNSQTICVGNSTFVFNPDPNGTWMSSNPQVATVDNFGNVTAVSEGMCDIFIQDNLSNITGNTTITVPSSTLNPIYGQDSVCVDGTIHLSSSPTGGSWSSSNTAIATINNSGEVTGVSVGTTTITYTLCNNSVTKTISVYLANPPTLTLLTAPATLHQTLTPDYLNATSDTAFYVPMDTVRFQIGGGATSAYLASGPNSLPKGVTGTFSNGIFTICGTPYLVAPFPTTSTIFNYTVLTTGGTFCVQDPFISDGDTLWVTDTTGTYYTGDITLSPPCFNTVSGSQYTTVCANYWTSITYSVSGSPTNVTASGLPPGLVGSFQNGGFIISGFAMQNSGSPETYNFTITTSGGGCFQTTFEGVIVVNPDVNLYQISSPGTENQTVCLNDPIAEIQYFEIGGYSSFINFSGEMPDGVTISNSGYSIVISGTPLEVGIYPYHVNLATFCGYVSYTGVLTVVDLPTLSPIAGPTTICQNSMTTLTNSVANGVWSSSNPSVAEINSNGTLVGISPGITTISYTYTNGNCSTSETITITVTETPVVSPITGPTSVCTNSTIVLTDQTDGGIWDSSNSSLASIDQNGLVTGNAVGYVTISYSLNNSCSVAQTYIIQVEETPVAQPIVGESGICTNSTTTFSTNSTAGQWSSADISIAMISQEGVVQGVSEGTCAINYTITNGSCSATSTQMITVFNCTNLELSSPAESDMQEICMHNLIIPIEYTLTGVATNVSITDGTLPSGITGTFANGIFTISGIPTQTGVYPYTISTSGSTFGPEVSLTGTITIEDIPVADFTYSINDLTVTFTNTTNDTGADYNWNFGSNTSIESDPIYTFSTSGTYTVTLSAENKCGTDEITQTIGLIGVDEVLADEFIVYPNPFHSNFTIQLENEESADIIVQDLAGKIVFEQQVYNKINSLNLEHLAKGHYLLNVKQGEQSVVKRITKQ